MVKVLSHVELDQMLEYLFVIYAGVESYDFFGVGVSIIIHICIPERSI